MQLGVLLVQIPLTEQRLTAGPNNRYPLWQVKVMIPPTFLFDTVTLPFSKVVILGHCITRKLDA